MLIVWLVQGYLLKMGAKLFDPFNISALLSVPKAECHILIHRRELPSVHRIPNLLRLKRHLIVTFLLFDNLKQIQSNQSSVVFPRAGMVIMDMPSLVSCKSGMYGAFGVMCNVYIDLHLVKLFYCLENVEIGFDQPPSFFNSQQ